MDLPTIELTLLNKLETGLLHLGGAAIDLIEEDDTRLEHRLEEPVCRQERRDPMLLTLITLAECSTIRKTDHIRFTQLGDTSLNDGQPPILCALVDNFRLADAVPAPQKDSLFRMEILDSLDEIPDCDCTDCTCH